MMDEFVSPEVWICRAEGGRRLCRVTVGDQGLVPFAPEYRKISPAVPGSRPKPLKTAGCGPRRGERAGNCGKPSREAVAASRDKWRDFTDILTLIEKIAIAKIYTKRTDSATPAR